MKFQEIEQKTQKHKNKIYKTLVSNINIFKNDWILDLRQEWIEEESDLPFHEFYQYYIEEYAEFYLYHYILHLICKTLKISISDMNVLSLSEKNKLISPFISKFFKNTTLY